MAKVLVAMSGGVDSSLAAAMLKEEGHDVTGVTLKVWQDGQKPSCELELVETPVEKTENSCCGVEAMSDARSVARTMEFPFYVFNYEDRFKESVIDNFVAEYRRGRTPNPCVACNDKVKFDPLLKAAVGLDSDKLATGHYARVEQDDQGNYHLYRAADRHKDQTYFLYRLDQQQLSRLLFPLGGMTKDQTRQRAGQMKLSTADKPESQDICFVPKEGYGSIIEQWAPEAVKEGPIVDRQGRELGRHRGVAFYTVGQRRGLNISAAEPLYVLELDPEANRVIVGTRDELASDSAMLEDLHWISGRRPEGPEEVTVKIRYAHPGAEAVVIDLGDGRAELKFKQAQLAVAPGQAAVFYRGDECLGGGVIFSNSSKPKHA